MKDGYVFAFFTTGRSTSDRSEDEVRHLQAAHIDNFRRLHKAGVLLLAGPCSDPDRQRRGIVLLRGIGDLAELSTHFAPDPYVTGGYMNLEAYPMEARILEIGANPSEAGIDEHVIVAVFDRPGFAGAYGGPTPDGEMLERLPREQRPRVLLTRGRDDVPLWALAIFKVAGTPTVGTILEESGVISASGGRAVHVWRQWLGKDSLLP